MATPRELRNKKKEAGWDEVSVQVPPELAKRMEEERDGTPKGRWLLQKALAALGIGNDVALTWGRAGRKRTRLPTLPDLRVPLQHLTYQPVSLPHYLASEVPRTATITLWLDNYGRTVVRFRKHTELNGTEVYRKARFNLQGEWSHSGHYIPATGKRE
jgi:hypothetical protein